MEQTTAQEQSTAVIDNNDLLAGIGEEEAAQAVTRYVVVEVNHNLYGVSTESTVELTSAEMTQITRVPQSPSYIAGVLNHRGTIIPVVDMRELLGFVPRSSEAERLSTLFNKLKDDHIAWLAALQDAVYLDKEFTKATDPNKCNFGKWYNSVIDGSANMSTMVMGDPILQSLFERFNAPHQSIHGIAESVLRTKNQGRVEEAIAMINKVRETELKTMCDLFDQVLEAISTKLESMLVITEVGDRKAAVSVDSVMYVADCRDDAIEVLPDTADNTEFVSGLVYQDDGTYILIVDLDHIYSTACPEE